MITLATKLLSQGSNEKFIKLEALAEEEDGPEDFLDEGYEAEELTIDLEAVLKHHRSVRIRVPPRVTASEGSAEDGAREIVVSKGSEEDEGVVF